MATSRKLTKEKREQKESRLKERAEEMDRDPEYMKMRTFLLEVFNSTDEALCRFTAHLMVSEDRLSEENKRLVEILNRNSFHSGILSDAKTPARLKEVVASKLLEHCPDDPAALIYVNQSTKIAEKASYRGKAAANALHSRPGGSREKRMLLSSPKYRRQMAF